MPFEFERQKIKDVILVKPKVFGDNRGFFMESYKKSEFFANGIDVEQKFIKNINSRTFTRIKQRKMRHNTDKGVNSHG